MAKRPQPPIKVKKPKAIGLTTRVEITGRKVNEPNKHAQNVDNLLRTRVIPSVKLSEPELKLLHTKFMALSPEALKKFDLKSFLHHFKIQRNRELK